MYRDRADFASYTNPHFVTSPEALACDETWTLCLPLLL